MLSTLRFYELYNAMKLHFKEDSNYDFFKYKGKTRVNENSFLKAKGRYLYEKWAKKLCSENTAIQFLAPNFAINECKWIGDFDNQPYNEFIAYKESLYYKFQNDVETYTNINPIKQCFSGSKSSWYYLIIANHATNGFVFSQFDKKYNNNILYENIVENILTFSPFVIEYFNLNDPAIKMNTRKIIKETLQENA